jgi:hypothetical protein
MREYVKKHGQTDLFKGKWAMQSGRSPSRRKQLALASFNCPNNRPIGPCYPWWMAQMINVTSNDNQSIGCAIHHPINCFKFLFCIEVGSVAASVCLIRNYSHYTDYENSSYINARVRAYARASAHAYARFLGVL